MARSFGAAKVLEIREGVDRQRAADQQSRDRAAYDLARRDAALARVATPETLRKLTVSVIDRMRDRGQIAAEQYLAAEEISRVCQAIAGSLSAKTSRYGQVTGGDARDWPPALARAYGERYCPWRDQDGRVLVRHRQSRCDVVFLVVLDNFGPRQVADRLGMDHRSVKSVLRDSLYRYAEIAEWVPRRSLAETDAIS